MPKFFAPADKPTDWQRLLAQPVKHWRTGYSAKSIAYSWTEAEGFPNEIRAVLESSDVACLHDLEFLIGIPEHEVPLPGRDLPSQNDVFVLAKGSDRLVCIAVESKVSEPFDKPVDKRFAKPTPGESTRLAFLLDLLELDRDDVGEIGYQLLHRTGAKALGERKSPITGTTAFLDAAYAKIHENWDANETGYAKPSIENWRWKRHLELGQRNVSPELQLERAIVNACGDDWSNQMPTASGLIGPAVDKRAAVDLVYREDATTYSFVELKVASDTPLFAAIEILMYGLLFVWSKNNQENLGYYVETQPVITANTSSSSAATFEFCGMDKRCRTDLRRWHANVVAGQRSVESGRDGGIREAVKIALELRAPFCNDHPDHHSDQLPPTGW